MRGRRDRDAGRVEPVLADDGRDQALRGEGVGAVGEPPGDRWRHVQRLLDEHVGAEAQRLLGERDVQPGRGADRDQAARRDRTGQAGEPRRGRGTGGDDPGGQRVPGGLVGVDDRGDAQPWMAEHGVGMGLADDAGADHGHGDGGHRISTPISLVRAAKARAARPKAAGPEKPPVAVCRARCGSSEAKPA